MRYTKWSGITCWSQSFDSYVFLWCISEHQFQMVKEEFCSNLEGSVYFTLLLSNSSEIISFCGFSMHSAQVMGLDCDSVESERQGAAWVGKVHTSNTWKRKPCTLLKPRAPTKICAVYCTSCGSHEEVHLILGYGLQCHSGKIVFSLSTHLQKLYFTGPCPFCKEHSKYNRTISCCCDSLWFLLTHSNEFLGLPEKMLQSVGVSKTQLPWLLQPFWFFF